MAINLAKYFLGVGAKRVSEVEIRPDSSHQHEFNGIGDFKKIFGPEKRTFRGKFIFLSDEEEKTIEVDGTLTWYDARKNHPTRTEYRLYYSANEVINKAGAQDLLIIARRSEEELLVILTPAYSTSEKQLLWLFGLAQIHHQLIVKDLSNEKGTLSYAAEFIINSLRIEVEEEGPSYLEYMLEAFEGQFPSTNIFSSFARSTLKDVSVSEDPDNTLLMWMQREEHLFKALERHLVQIKLHNGFGSDKADVDDFISFSLGVQNRRKSRAGFAFENHLSKVFNENGIKYSNGKVTELNKKPDFIFPGINEYHSSTFDTSLLTMLGVKTSSKDRWRQVLSEASKISNKHLLTLEPAISKNQTDEMASDRLQLVVPAAIQQTYTLEQRKQIMSLKDFILLVKGRQNY